MKMTPTQATERLAGLIEPQPLLDLMEGKEQGAQQWKLSANDSRRGQ